MGQRVRVCVLPCGCCPAAGHLEGVMLPVWRSADRQWALRPQCGSTGWPLCSGDTMTSRVPARVGCLDAMPGPARERHFLLGAHCALVLGYWKPVWPSHERG